ncbi:MAG: hypothetical protein ACOY4W_03680 [Thermodesulfobacteriota bacterium]
MSGIVVYDCEIRRGVVCEGEARRDGVLYAGGWEDFTGMGIACICAMEISGARRPHVFLEDNLEEFQQLLDGSCRVVGFNNHNFDDRLCAAHGIRVPAAKSCDLQQIIWQASGLGPDYTRETHAGFSLNALCRANGLGGKEESAAQAPVWWQAGRIGRLVDYCLQDVQMTVALLDLVVGARELRNPLAPEQIISFPPGVLNLYWPGRVGLP